MFKGCEPKVGTSYYKPRKIMLYIWIYSRLAMVVTQPSVLPPSYTPYILGDDEIQTGDNYGVADYVLGSLRCL